MSAADPVDATSLLSLRPKKRKHGPHWHRCPVHRRHTCNHKNRCKHRLHRLHPATTPPTTPPTPTTPPAPPIEPSATLSAADLHLVRRFSYGYTPIPARDLGADIVLDDFAQLPAALKTLKLL